MLINLFDNAYKLTALVNLELIKGQNLMVINLDF